MTAETFVLGTLFMACLRLFLWALKKERNNLDPWVEKYTVCLVTSSTVGLIVLFLFCVSGFQQGGLHG